MYCVLRTAYHLQYIMVWHGMAWYNMIWHGMVWHDIAWHGIAWYMYTAEYMLQCSIHALASQSFQQPTFQEITWNKQGIDLQMPRYA